MSPPSFCGPMFMHQIQKCCPQFPEVYSLPLPHTLWNLGPSPGCPLPVCGPSILDHSLCTSTPLLERACAATRPLPLASFLVAVCTLAGPAAGPGLSYSSASLAQACTCLPRGAAFSTHSSQVLVVSLTSASCSASPTSPLLCAPEPQADHVA